ncbi:hypothetical protein E2562_028377 [Oryza meyeriana var. granulata]|uniref:Retrotransposon gag domain-containing protein n=1 Tax=Oryza meyeriana var. granulata TaxID=110450 RepID=A0A6G1CT82_9ORYZ|nr:hypothetical protein E2562_028377 [Oryza meyeriana var. granulata]
MGQDEPTTGGPKSGVTLKEWVGMKLDNFDGSSTPVQAAVWLSYVEDKMEAFEFEWRFYLVTFLDKMKLDLSKYVQDKKTVAEYKIGFNQIVRFVPHVAHDEVEKARQFHQGLKPAIRHVVSSLGVREIERAILVVQVIRRGSLNVTMLIVAAPLSHALQEGLLLSIAPFPNLWYNSDDGSASFFSRAHAAYTSIPAATFRYSTGPYTLVWGLLVAPRHYSFDTCGSLGSCTGYSYYGSLFFD